MELQTIIDLIRQSCFIDDPKITEDSQYLALEDKDIEIIVRLAQSRVSSYKTEDPLYPIVLHSKREIYSRLAVKYANDIDLKGNAGTLYKEQKFNHYKSLVEQLETEWDNFLKQEEANTDVSNTDLYSGLAQGEVFLKNNYFSLRNVEYANKPLIGLVVDNVYDTYVEMTWQLKRINRFSKYLVYLSEKPIIDPYTNEIRGNLMFTTNDIHRNKLRLNDLKPNTLYHLAVIVQEQNGLKGYDEVNFVTKEEVVNE
jgi:hypothetical protein